MSKATCNTCSVIHKRLSEIQLGEYDRRQAVNAMHEAEAIADAVIWVKDRIAALGTKLPRLAFKSEAGVSNLSASALRLRQ